MGRGVCGQVLGWFLDQPDAAAGLCVCRVKNRLRAHTHKLARARANTHTHTHTQTHKSVGREPQPIPLESCPSLSRTLMPLVQVAPRARAAP